MNNNKQSNELSPQEKKKRNFLVVFPVLVLPFVTFLLWSMGVIGQPGEKEPIKQQRVGFRLDLPGAVTSKDSNWNKLKFYEQAQKDSSEYKKLQKNDPYYKSSQVEDLELSNNISGLRTNKGESNYLYDPYPATTKRDRNEEKVYQRLAQLNEELKVQQEEEPTKTVKPDRAAAAVSVNTQDIDRLESMMQMMQTGSDGEDKEMQEINSVLEKILDIQNPERQKEKITAQSLENKKRVFTVETADVRPSFTRLDDHKKNERSDTLPVRPTLSGNGFYAARDRTTIPVSSNTISAVIPRTQMLVTGAVVQLQLAAEIVVAGVVIPKDQFVYGQAVLNGERLLINISSIRFGSHILPVSLSVYDLDGLEGIYIPGSISREVAKQSGDQAIQSLGISSLDPSIGAQAASAGIQAAKSLIGKKAKLTRVTVRDGYTVYLKDKNMDK